jgi:hypothetical protein
LPCIFCKSEEDLTEEHLFPAFVGGTLTVPDATCTNCNKKRCSSFEDEIARATQPVRHVMGIKNRYREIPDSPVTYQVEDLTLEGKRKPDGDLILRNHVQKAKLEDGRTRTDALFTNVEDAEKFTERALKRGETVTDVPLPKDITIQPVSRQTIQFAFTLAAHQLVSKIALVSIAYEYGTAYALEAQFDKLRERIFHPNPPAHIFANEDFIANELRTPRQHSVITHINAEMHMGWSAVTLFGGLSYIVHLTDAFEERRDRSFSLHYDAVTRKLYHPIVLYDEYALIRKIQSDDTQFGTVPPVDKQWYRIVEPDCRARGLALERTEDTRSM